MTELVLKLSSTQRSRGGGLSEYFEEKYTKHHIDLGNSFKFVIVTTPTKQQQNKTQYNLNTVVGLDMKITFHKIKLL